MFGFSSIILLIIAIVVVAVIVITIHNKNNCEVINGVSFLFGQIRLSSDALDMIRSSSRDKVMKYI